MYKNYEELVEYLGKKNFQKKINALSSKYSGKKVIIYGAGTLFDAINDNYDLSKFDVAGISDIKFTEESDYKGYKTIPPENINEYNPDVVLIALLDTAKAIEYFEEVYSPEYGKFKYEFFYKPSFLDALIELFANK